MVSETGHTADDKFFIHAAGPTEDDRTRVLKQHDTFAVFDRLGDIRTHSTGGHGLYHEETRFLSRMVMLLQQTRPLLLSSGVSQDNTVLAIDLTNADIESAGSIAVPHGSLHLLRQAFILNGACYTTVRVSNHGTSNVSVGLSFHFEADFKDIFEVRGTPRERRGQKLDPVVNGNVVVLRYQGLDNVTRRARITCSQGGELSAHDVRYTLSLPPGGREELQLTVACEVADRRPEILPSERARTKAIKALARGHEDECSIVTSNPIFNDWLDRSLADLRMMTTATAQGLYPYAGVPWYSTVFGRDGLITAMETLWANPLLARGVLSFLAAHQADEEDASRDAEPGKILHEMRRGEMAELREVPFGRYYGSIDSTPLFVMLCGRYQEATGDLELIRSLWSHIERALQWMDRYGDTDGDGFIEYARHSRDGLVQQGWKDSWDSVFHADGSAAHGPIALCEVQGYAYAAWREAARLARLLDKCPQSDTYELRANKLRNDFDKAFWCEELASYAIALDGEKRQCKVRTSNAGHCLFSEIASREHARKVAETLMSPASWSGWGIRTVAATEARYNPISYHNGTIWPHDNALIADGFARYRLKKEVINVTEGLFAMSAWADLRRLPELFCGFERGDGMGPTLYPVACNPQAWAAGAVFMLLRACLGLHVMADARSVHFSYPVLPPSLDEVIVKNLRVGRSTMDLQIHRYPEGAGVNVLRRDEDIDVVVLR